MHVRRAWALIIRLLKRKHFEKTLQIRDMCFRVRNAEYVTSKAQEWGHPLHEALTGWGKELGRGESIGLRLAWRRLGRLHRLGCGQRIGSTRLSCGCCVSRSECSSGARACVAALVAIGPDRPGIMKPA